MLRIAGRSIQTEAFQAAMISVENWGSHGRCTQQFFSNWLRPVWQVRAQTHKLETYLLCYCGWVSNTRTMICFDAASVTTSSVAAFWPCCCLFVLLKTVDLSFFHVQSQCFRKHVCEKSGAALAAMGCKSHLRLRYHLFGVIFLYLFISFSLPCFHPLVWFSFLVCRLWQNAGPIENAENVAERSGRSRQAFCQRIVPLRLSCKHSRGRERKPIALLSCDALRSRIMDGEIEGWRKRAKTEVGAFVASWRGRWIACSLSTVCWHLFFCCFFQYCIKLNHSIILLKSFDIFIHICWFIYSLVF